MHEFLSKDAAGIGVAAGQGRGAGEPAGRHLHFRAGIGRGADRRAVDPDDQLIALAQDNRLPQASLDREFAPQMAGRTTGTSTKRHRALTPPGYCRPCLFYAGDFDSDASDANGLANEFDTTVSTGAVAYAPFIVPKGETWTVTGLFTDNFLSIQLLDPVTIPYEIRKGIPRAGGNGGTLSPRSRISCGLPSAISATLGQ